MLNLQQQAIEAGIKGANSPLFLHDLIALLGDELPVSLNDAAVSLYTLASQHRRKLMAQFRYTHRLHGSDHKTQGDSAAYILRIAKERGYLATPKESFLSNSLGSWIKGEGKTQVWGLKAAAVALDEMGYIPGDTQPLMRLMLAYAADFMMPDPPLSAAMIDSLHALPSLMKMGRDIYYKN